MKSISTEYRVVAEIPEEVYRAFGNTPEYAGMSCAAVHGHLEAGSCNYDDPFEWATFSTRGKAEEALRKLNEMIAHFEAKLAAQESRDDC